MKTSEIRQRFLDHFARNDHHVVPSASLIADDPNLLFVNAGMVPFKPYFLGQVPPPYKRAVSVQKCVRTLDIDEVGKTTRHGSFFQMNGNFSFGDYFKEGAIELAWEFVTGPRDAGGLGFSPDLVWPTVYLDDDEAFRLWQRVSGLPPERIQRRGKADNTWDMGVPGPAGPCSEIFIDRGPDYGREGGPVVDEERYLEIWNLVFMQYERGASTGPEKGDYEILGDLPAPNIDTGMGLERVACLLQDVDNLYEIDETRPILSRAAEMTGKTYGAHSGHIASRSHPDDVRLRVVADHVRTGLMLIADGVTPGNEGRGYVLRRILRRAVRAMRLLGYEDPALPELFPVARDCMSASYPEVAGDYDRIASYAYGEEEAFRQTLRAGTTILDTAVRDTRAVGGSTLSGEQAFALHDTYGFPIDLTLEMAAEQGVAVDEDGFRRLMDAQRQRAKADARARKTGHADMSVFRSLLDAHGPTEWLAYTALQTESTVLALLGADGTPATVAAEGEIVTAFLDRTPFYAESGGQHADAGLLTGPSVRAEVLDVQRPVKGLVAHQLRVVGGTLAVGDHVTAAVDPDWRVGARQAHSGTHVVHAALRQVLGPSALQSGSFNRPGYLRLDYAWRGALSTASRSEVEEVANRAVRADLPVSALFMTLPEAKAAGALALFGETYDETVRVVEIGGAWSRELCGGTHVEHASQIGAIAVTAESSVGAGQRRVEAATGFEAFRYLARERDLVDQVVEQLKAPRAELPERVAALVDRLRTAERELEKLRVAATLSGAAELAARAADVSGVAVVAVEAPEGTGAGDVRALVTEVRGRLDAGRPGVVAVANRAGGRATLVVTVNGAARTAGLSASALVKAALSGRGGGTDELAQGGGVDASQTPGLLTAVTDAVARTASGAA